MQGGADFKGELTLELPPEMRVICFARGIGADGFLTVIHETALTDAGVFLPCFLTYALCLFKAELFLNRRFHQKTVAKETVFAFGAFGMKSITRKEKHHETFIFHPCLPGLFL